MNLFHVDYNLLLKRKIVSLLLIFACWGHSSGQNVPGYLGMKAMIDYNFNSPFPTQLPPHYSNFVHNINLNYVVRRRAQVGVSFEIFTITDDQEFNSDFYETVEVTAIGANFDWYARNSIAPIGRFFRLEVRYFQGKQTYAEWNGNEYEPTKRDFNAPYAGLGYGTRRIFFDRMVFNIGGALGWTFLNSDDKLFDELKTLRTVYSYRMHVGVGVLLF